MPLNLVPFSDLALLVPALIVGAAGLAVLIVDMIRMSPKSEDAFYISLLGLAAGLIAAQVFRAPPGDVVRVFRDCLRFDDLVQVTNTVVVGCSLFLVLISPQYLKNRRIPTAEYYALMLFATMAMMLLAASNELLTLFLNLELLSFTLYILTGMERENLRSTEAAFKYFLVGSFAAAFLLFGLTMVYGATGTTSFEGIKEALAGGANEAIVSHPLFASGGFALMLVGFGFKLTLAPFHMYAPDLYAGAPTPVAGLIAAGSKVAALAAFVQFFRLLIAWDAVPAGLVAILWGLAILSIVLGNLGALVQPNIKRLLAYSGVAHGGYALIPLLAGLARPDLMPQAERAIGYYLLAYALMTVVAFGVAATLGPQGEGDIDRYAGLARRAPLFAAVMTLALISLTGVPLSVGFLGKVYLFSVAVEAELYGLAIFGVLASVASAYYYLRVIVKMYMEDQPVKAAEREATEGVNVFALVVGSVAIVMFAVVPALFILS